MMFAQSYNDMWSKIEKLNDDDKPKSVIEEAEKVYAKALEENCFPQMMKARICIIEKQCDLDPELFVPDEYEKTIKKIEEDSSLSNDDKTARLALAHCMLASAYRAMRDSYVHDFDQETREQFPQKAVEHILASLTDMKTLSNINANDYTPLVSTYKYGIYFNHDLLSPLLQCALDDEFANLKEEEKLDLLNKAIAIYEAQGNKNAVAILKLQELKMRYNSKVKANYISTEKYRTELKTLLEKTMGEETDIDVVTELCHVYSDNVDEKLTYARWAIEKWKGNERLKPIEGIVAEIMATHIYMDAESNILADQYFALNLNYENANKAKLTIREYSGVSSNYKLSEKGKIIKERYYDCPLDEENEARRAKNLPTKGADVDSLKLPAGHYTFVVETEGDKNLYEITVTTLRAIATSIPEDGGVRITVLDNKSGRPVKDATVMTFTSWEREYGKKPTKKYKTDANGVVSLPNYHDLEIRYILVARDESDYGTPREDCTCYFTPTHAYERYDKSRFDNINTYTDRSIYRPGQKVLGAALCFWQYRDDANVSENTKINITIKDPDYKVVYSASLTTNEMGSASFEFDIPKDAKLGEYRIAPANYGCRDYTSFHVEEYKRPTFEVLFDEKQKDIKHNLGDKFTVKGSAMMFTGAPNQGASVKYRIEWAEASYSWYRQYNYAKLTEGETVTADDGSFNIDVVAELPMFVFSDSISFRIIADVTDVAGEMESDEFIFNVKNPNYKKQEDISTKDDNAPKDELRFSNNEISENEDVTVTFKAQEDDAYVHYYVFSRTKTVKEGTKILKLGEELSFDIKYKEEYEDGVNVTVFYVRNGHIYASWQNLPYVRPEKRLKLSWKTFRDNLTPGQNEEWVLNVNDHKGNKIPNAEVLAVMYDASLDNLYPHNWELAIYFQRNIFNPHIMQTNANPGLSFSLSPNIGWFGISTRTFDHISSVEHQRWYRRPKMRLLDMRSRAKGLAVNEGAMSETMAFEASPALAMVSQSESEQAAQPAQMRSNLEELAFFYPHLLTDEDGEAHMAFSLPDCLTEWKFMGIVHTKTLDYGSITATATAKKDFMLQPNMPRFLRTGDKGEIRAKIQNLSDRTVKGKATLRILDAETEEVLTTKVAEFLAEANRSTSVSFPVSADFQPGEYICEIIASDGSASDGERNRLPILSTKVDVVENVPFYLNGPGTKQVDLSAMFNGGSPTVTDRSIEIGYTDNPALRVFESLSALQNPEHDNAPCYAAALYTNLVLLDMSNVLGDHIKDFNKESAQATADKALEKLRKLQLSNGSWSWFEGMEGNFYITLTVAQNLHRLQSYLNRHEEKCPREIANMLSKALKYLDKQELKFFKERKRLKSHLRPYDTDLQYLSIATDPDKEMLNTYLDEMAKDGKAGEIATTWFGNADAFLTGKDFPRAMKELDGDDLQTVGWTADATETILL